MNFPEHNMASECLGLFVLHASRELQGWKTEGPKPYIHSFQYGFLGKIHAPHAVKALVCVPFALEQLKRTDSMGGGAGMGDFLSKCAMCLEHLD